MRLAWVLVWLAVGAGCVAAPDATRDGGVQCRTDDDCNPGVACGRVHLCVLRYCAEDTVLRVCVDGAAGDASM